MSDEIDVLKQRIAKLESDQEKLFGWLATLALQDFSLVQHSYWLLQKVLPEKEELRLPPEMTDEEMELQIASIASVSMILNKAAYEMQRRTKEEGEHEE